MAQDTPRLGLNRFDQWETGWDHTDAVETIDEHAIDRGPLSERPSSGEYDDELFYATDQSVLWGWDESQSDWTVRGGTGSASQALPEQYVEALQAEVSNSERGPKPGQVQAELDAAHDAGGGRVRLWPERAYDPDSTWVVKDGVVLDFNGSHVDLSSDIDVVEVRPGGRVVEPRIDATGVGYSSRAIHLLAEDYNADWFHQSRQSPVIAGGELQASTGEGTAVSVHGKGGAITFIRAFVKSTGFGVGLEIFNEGDGSGNGFVNGNSFEADLNDPQKGVHIHGTGGTGAPVDNRFHGEIQPKDGGGSDWALDFENAKDSEFTGRLWDPGKFASDTMVRWQSGASNNVVRLNSLPAYVHVNGSPAYVDNSSAASNGFQFPETLRSSHPESISVGHNAETSGDFATSVGALSSTDERGFAGGRLASAGNRGVAVGTDSSAGGDRATAAGVAATADNNRATAVGDRSSCGSTDAVAIGTEAAAQSFGTVALGAGATASRTGEGRIAVDQLVFGASDGTVPNSDLDNEDLTVVADEGNSQFQIRYRDSSGNIQTGTVAFD